MGSRSIIYNVTELDLNSYKCSDRGLILPLISEYTWPLWVRAVLYFVFLLYLFLGIAKIADIFMVSIEQITSQRKKIKFINYEGNEDYVEKKVWNDTVANLTLMALGSSCPEILLAIIEIVGNNFMAGELGPGTIVGSAAYNLLIISGLCVVAISSPNVLRIENFAVFLMTTFWSIFAYIWLFLVLAVISPNVVELWEAILTLAFFGVLVTLSYMAEKNFYLGKKSDDDDDDEKESDFDLRSLKQFIKYLDKYELPDHEKEKLIQKYLSPTVSHSALSFRIKASKQLTGSNNGFNSMRNELFQIYEEIINKIEMKDDEENETVVRKDSVRHNRDSFYANVEFSSPIYITKASDRKCVVTLIRSNYMIDDLNVKVSTKDCSALAEKDYEPIDYVDYKFECDEKEKKIEINLLDGANENLGSKVFFINVSINEDCRSWARHGKNKSCMVIISDSDLPGEIEFSQQTLNVNENDREAIVTLIRKNGASGRATVKVDTYDITATNKVDYIGLKGHEIVFEDGEVEKIIKIKILDDKNQEDNEKFGVRFVDVNGANLGAFKNIVITILDNDELESKFREAIKKIKLNPDYLRAQKLSWIEQFRCAANVNEGDSENASAFDYIMHAISFPWKMMFAFLPPPGILNGWLCFVVSLGVIGVLTALVGDAAAIFGCLINLKDSITAISFVAMGTSLPDTFASFISAKNERTADNAIGNVTGSNSVNVFLGLGLPWVLASIYWKIKGLPFTVKAGDLSFSIIIFSIACVLCISTLILRRYLSIFGKGELGGPTIPKLATGIFFGILWILYILISALKSYELF